jgi:MIP family channel proteins
MEQQSHMSMQYLAKSALAEFLGTYILVVVGASAVAQTVAQGGSTVGVSFAFGLALMALFYSMGTFSGAHFNPATSLGFAVSGRMHWGLMLLYWIMQFAGGFAAAATVAYFYGGVSGDSVGSLTFTDAVKAMVVEMFLTFFLVLTILLVTGNPMLAVASGLAIGLSLTFVMLAGYPLTGASTNPARSLGTSFFGGNLGSYWIYIVGPLLGALIAGLLYKLITIDYTCKVLRDECGNEIRDECGRRLKTCKTQVVNKCGVAVKTDCNQKVYEEKVVREHKLGHHQENALTAIGGYLEKQGYDPSYLKQEMGKAMEKKHSLLDNVMEKESTSSPTLVIVEPVQEAARPMSPRRPQVMSPPRVSSPSRMSSPMSPPRVSSPSRMSSPMSPPRVSSPARMTSPMSPPRVSSSSSLMPAARRTPRNSTIMENLRTAAV